MSPNKLISVMVVTTVCLLYSSLMVSAVNYVVGDNSGWTYDVENWTDGKVFRAGDTLEFKYSPAHNVVVVDKSSYGSCTVPAGAKTYNSGHDKITISEDSYFICGILGHCFSGMKINVTLTV